MDKVIHVPKSLILARDVVYVCNVYIIFFNKRVRFLSTFIESQLKCRKALSSVWSETEHCFSLGLFYSNCLGMNFCTNWNFQFAQTPDRNICYKVYKPFENLTALLINVYYHLLLIYTIYPQ